MSKLITGQPDRIVKRRKIPAIKERRAVQKITIEAPQVFPTLVGHEGGCSR